MKNFSVSICLLISFLMMNSCSQNNNNSLIRNANFDSQTNILKIDYAINPDTSLLQIIELSNIRKSGYGVLINMQNSYSKSELDDLKLKFQKMDINAIHSFDIAINDSIKRNIRIAMEGAKFIWLLNSSDSEWNSRPIGDLIESLQNRTKERILIVVD